MILQKDLSLFRLDNQMPDQYAPEKYEYQLWSNGKLAKTQFSDSFFQLGLVSVIGEKINLELFPSIAEVGTRELEDGNIYLLDIKN